VTPFKLKSRALSLLGVHVAVAEFNVGIEATYARFVAAVAAVVAESCELGRAGLAGQSQLLALMLLAGEFGP